MQPATAPEIDPAAAVAPAIGHTVPWRLRSAKVVAPMRLRVTFVDGTLGDVDMKRFLSHPRVRGTVFEPLVDPTLFAQVEIMLGSVQWPNGADLAPDAMYDAIRAQGCWVPE